MFHLFLEHTADAVCLFDPSTASIADCNEATAALMRCRSRADLVGKRLEKLLPVQPDGSPTVEAARWIEETLKSGNSRFEWMSQRFDGTKVRLEVNATAIERDGGTVIVLVLRNITEPTEAEDALLESEARFRSFFERNADAMSLFDPHTLRYIEANEAAARLIGAPGREALRNVSPVERWPERQPDGRLSVEKVREMIRLALAKGSHRFEWWSRRYDGSELPLDIVATAIPSGKPTLLSLVYRDTSEYKRAEGEIRQLNASLEKRVVERTTELMRANDQLRRTEEHFRKRSEQVQKHRDVLLELAHSDKSNFAQALQRICSLSAAALDVERVSYWSVQENDSEISCEVLYRRNTDSFDMQLKGSRLGFAEYPAYFEELASHVLTHPATSALAEKYLKPLGISSLLDAPVWECGEGVGVLRHEHIGPAREWSPKEVDFVSALASRCRSRWRNQIAHDRNISCARARRGCARVRRASARPFERARRSFHCCG
jgi:PAS domain S-box-containing protein